ncbi:hypothetical protein [Streptomyces sp. NPDC057579]|uniref:hypothetical protein n=1 Tax=unclassified Streptomyces TaxID=2593676 RepID=UPI0036B8A77A
MHHLKAFAKLNSPHWWDEWSFGRLFLGARLVLSSSSAPAWPGFVAVPDLWVPYEFSAENKYSVNGYLQSPESSLL